MVFKRLMLKRGKTWRTILLPILMITIKTLKMITISYLTKFLSMIHSMKAWIQIGLKLDCLSKASWIKYSFRTLAITFLTIKVHSSQSNQMIIWLRLNSFYSNLSILTTMITNIFLIFMEVLTLLMIVRTLLTYFICKTNQ